MAGHSSCGPLAGGARRPRVLGISGSRGRRARRERARRRTDRPGRL